MRAGGKGLGRFPDGHESGVGGIVAVASVVITGKRLINYDLMNTPLANRCFFTIFRSHTYGYD